MANLTDSALHRLLASPRDSRPGLLDNKSRLKMLKKLSLQNTEITDVSMRYITQYLPHLASLNLSGCWKVVYLMMIYFQCIVEDPYILFVSVIYFIYYF